jgi:tRNA/rRNA methyltransferase
LGAAHHFQGNRDFNMNPTDALARIRIVLSRPSHPGNIGSAARAMKTMGLSRLVLVAPRAFPDPEAGRLAAGADDILDGAQVVDDLDAALADSVHAVAISARLRDLGPEPRPAREAAQTLIARAMRGETVALVFGNETAGLANADLQRCAGMAYIAAQPGFSSLNLAAAVQVLAYELRQAAFAGAPPLAAGTTPFAAPPATHAEQEGFYAHLERVMRDSGFLDPAQPRRLMAKLRRLFARAGLEKDEVTILRGFLSAVESWRGPRR